MMNYYLTSGNAKTPRIVVTASDQELKDRHYRGRLWMGMKNKDVSSRMWVDLIADALYSFDGLLLQPNGEPWHYREVDDVVNDRTIRNFLQEIDGQPRRTPRKIEPLRYYDVTFRIKWPDIARHFSR